MYNKSINTELFTGRAAVYDNYRPGYPESMYEYIYANILKTAGSIADVGSGTGLLSEGFLKRGSIVYGVEPNIDMRTAGEKRLKNYDNFKSIAGTSENTLLEANSVDLITAASAFHWFDPLLFAQECIRVLRKGGHVALIYNKRDKNAPIVREMPQLSANLSKNEDFNSFFQGNYKIQTFGNSMSFDLTAFIGNLLSHSGAPLKEDDNYDEFIQTAKALFERFEAEGKVLIPYITHVYHGQFK